MSLPQFRPVDTAVDGIPSLRPMDRRPLGQILVESGELSITDQLRTLSMQQRIEARYGDILLAHGLIGKDRLYATIARQFSTEVANLSAVPPDAEMIDAWGAENCLEHAIIPWCKRFNQVLIATARPEQFEAHRPSLEKLFGPVRMVVTSEGELHKALLDSSPKALTLRAETRVAEAESCRRWPSGLLARAAWIVALLLLTALLLFPQQFLAVLFGWAVLTLIASSLMKLTAALAEFRAPPTPLAEDTSALAHNMAQRLPAGRISKERMPTVSIMIPLFNETRIARRLIERMDRLDYPRELLDICIVTEADDTATYNALMAVELPAHMRVIRVPGSSLRTKPRALNYALDFCRGSIIGVYDAEDAPDPEQIRKVVHRFRHRGADLACLQGVLDFYNSRTNWLSRCFAVEYAVWFRVVLPGMVRLGMAIPLGGTTLFFRRNVLEELGGWDAHNVTEDADLGIRLARHGYRTELINTVTKEEANCWFWPWVRQRSRWLKGYAITWAVHTRNPIKLFKDLGAWRFFGVQLFFLTTLSQFVLAPVLWSFMLIPLGLPHPFSDVGSALPITVLSSIFILSEVITVSIGVFAVRDAEHRFLVPWVPTLVLYFPLAALAAYKGLAELITRPFYWDKTHHGRSDGAQDPAISASPVNQAVSPPAE